MDSKSSSKKEAEVARESLIAISNTSPEKILERESLIAISNTSPDKVLESNSVSESKKSDGVALPNCDQEDDKFRSELISISYADSPDVKTGLISPGV